MEKNHFKTIVDLFSIIFIRGIKTTSLKSPWKCNNIYFSFNLFKAYILVYFAIKDFFPFK